MLRGYLGRTMPDWDVVLLDLNLWCFDQLLAGLGSGAIHLSPHFLQEIGGNAADLVAAAQFLKGQSSSGFFDSPELYDRHAGLFLRFTERFAALLGGDAEKFCKGGDSMPLLDAMVDRVRAEQPDIVGVSMIFSDQLPVGAALGRRLRNESGIKVFFGGSCFSSGYADGFAEGAVHFLDWYPDSADAIVIGDGEEPLRQLLLSEGRPEGIAGVAYRNAGQIERLPPQFRKEIDDFGAPDFSTLRLFDYYSPEAVVPVLLSRGCYWRRCTFCVHYFSAGNTYRMHSIEHVVAMLRELVAQGVSNFSFVDEMIAPGYFVKLATAIKAAGLKISYYALSKPSRGFTPRVLQQMADSGCKYVIWGVESGCQRVLDLMCKGTRKEEIADVLREAGRVGIANHVYIICGFPTETVAEYTETIRFLDENRDSIYAIHRGVFSLEAGSPIAKEPSRFGIAEIWLRKETSLGGRLGFRSSSGMTREEATQMFQQSLPFFRIFNPYARYLAVFRDHALLVYAKRGATLHPQRRTFPQITYLS